MLTSSLLSNSFFQHLEREVFRNLLYEGLGGIIIAPEMRTVLRNTLPSLRYEAHLTTNTSLGSLSPSPSFRNWLAPTTHSPTPSSTHAHRRGSGSGGSGGSRPMTPASGTSSPSLVPISAFFGGGGSASVSVSSLGTGTSARGTGTGGGTGRSTISGKGSNRKKRSTFIVDTAAGTGAGFSSAPGPSTLTAGSLHQQALPPLRLTQANLRRSTLE